MCQFEWYKVILKLLAGERAEMESLQKVDVEWTFEDEVNVVTLKHIPYLSGWLLCKRYSLVPILFYIGRHPDKHKKKKSWVEYQIVTITAKWKRDYKW